MEGVLAARGFVRALVVAIVGVTLAAGCPPQGLAAGHRDDAMSWQAPNGCPSAVEVRGEISRLLGKADAGVWDTEVTARAVVTHGAAWSVTLETELAGRRGLRSIGAASCAALADATALIVALMIDPDAVSKSQAVAGPPTATPAPDRQPEMSVPLAPTATPAPPATVTTVSGSKGNPSRWSPDFLVSGFAAGSYGVLPSLDAGLGMGLGVEGQRWRVELRGTTGLRRDQVAAAMAPPGAYGRFAVSTANLVGCARAQSGRLGFGPCAVLEAGLVSAEGHGTTETAAVKTPWLAAGAGAFASVALGARVKVPLHVDALFPLVRPDFVVRNVDGVVYRAPLLGLRVTAGLEVHF